jgi:hypothetical protein
MLSKLQDEVRANRFICEERLARELDDKESQLIECDGMLRAEPMSEEQIFELQQVSASISHPLFVCQGCFELVFARLCLYGRVVLQDIRQTQQRIEHLTDQQQALMRCGWGLTKFSIVSVRDFKMLSGRPRSLCIGVLCLFTRVDLLWFLLSVFA